MPTGMSKKKKRKIVRFKTIKIKVTARQKKSLENFCKARKTTPNKIIKKSIRPLLENYSNLVVERKSEKIKQLQLFGEE
jgi:hypothetical protein